MTISTFIEFPDQLEWLSDINITFLILDLPFCSIRPHTHYDWSTKELQLLSSQYQIVLNLDGIYTDHELMLIKSTIQHRKLDQLFHSFRIQDPGLIRWITSEFPHIKIQCNPETGHQNAPGIQSLIDHGLNVFVLNHETPFRSIQSIIKQCPNCHFELFVQGPICIQYSRRQFLSNLYNSDPTIPIRLTAEDPELPKRLFTFLNTAFGHFMFAQFHRCLGKYANKLNALSSVTWLIDARGESPHYFKTALYLYNSLLSLSSDDIFDQLSQLQIESNKPQKPGFFLSNNTDYDWRNASSHVKSNPIGVIRSAKKQDSILIEFFNNISTPADFICLNPDQSSIEICTDKLKDIHHNSISSISSFHLYLIPPTKGIQVNGLLYLKNS